jgi:hypothetical protein
MKKQVAVDEHGCEIECGIGFVFRSKIQGEVQDLTR